MSLFFDSIKVYILKLLPSLSYRGVVDTQLNLYRKLHQQMIQSDDASLTKYRLPTTEQGVLNDLLETRRLSWRGDIDANHYFEDLKHESSKTLERVIQGIVEYEYLDSPQSLEIRAKKQIPDSFVEKFRNEIKAYIKNKLDQLE